MRPHFDGVLFFPVTPFTDSGVVDLDALAQHIAKGVDAGPGGVFAACGTGEFHALDDREFGDVVRTAVEVVAGRVPVYAGAGGQEAGVRFNLLCDHGRHARLIPHASRLRHRLRRRLFPVVLPAQRRLLRAAVPGVARPRGRSGLLVPIGQAILGCFGGGAMSA